jgi:hypothetical protein
VLKFDTLEALFRPHVWIHDDPLMRHRNDQHASPSRGIEPGPKPSRSVPRVQPRHGRDGVRRIAKSAQHLTGARCPRPVVQSPHSAARPRGTCRQAPLPQDRRTR